jgi:hypothetical protein
MEDLHQRAAFGGDRCSSGKFPTPLQLCQLFLAAACLSQVALVNAQNKNVPLCGPNHTMPAGAITCKDADGRQWAAPPPVRRPNGAVVGPPAGTRQTEAVSPPPPAGETGTKGADGQQPKQPSTPSQQSPDEKQRQEIWTNVAWIAAITALVAAVAGLIRAFRKP